MLARTQAGDMMRDRCGDLTRKAGLAHDDRQQRTVDALQAADKIRFDAVTRKRYGSPFQQSLRRDAQHAFEEIDRCFASQDGIQSFAETDPRRSRVAHGTGDKLAASKFEKSPVANVVARSPIENPNRLILCDPSAQHLARLVPVDQEDERGADRLKEGVAPLARFRIVVSGDKIERALVAQFLGFLLLKSAPAHRETAQHVGKEPGAGAVHIRVCHCDSFILDPDHDDVRVGHADIILDSQPRSASYRRGRETGMIELQVRGRGNAAHEGFDSCAIMCPQPVCKGARDHFLSATGREPIENLVQVHYQPVQTIALLL